MALPVWMDNLIAYNLQIAILASAGTLLAYLLRLRMPRVMLWYWQILLLACLVLPGLQNWKHPAQFMGIRDIRACVLHHSKHDFGFKSKASVSYDTGTDWHGAWSWSMPEIDMAGSGISPAAAFFAQFQTAVQRNARRPKPVFPNRSACPLLCFPRDRQPCDGRHFFADGDSPPARFPG